MHAQRIYISPNPLKLTIMLISQDMEVMINPHILEAVDSIAFHY